MTEQDKKLATENSIKTDPNQPKMFQIKVEGHLGEQWAEWFDGLSITWEDSGYTLLTGPVVDQAALYGVLKKVRDLGMSLHAVNQIETKE